MAALEQAAKEANPFETLECASATGLLANVHL
jgi:hypothetical protein